MAVGSVMRGDEPLAQLCPKSECGSPPILQRRVAQRGLNVVERIPIATSGDARLPPLEGDVLALVAVGNTDGEITCELGLTSGRVRHCVRSAMLRLCARNRVQDVTNHCAVDPRRCASTASNALDLSRPREGAASTSREEAER